MNPYKPVYVGYNFLRCDKSDKVPIIIRGINTVAHSPMEKRVKINANYLRASNKSYKSVNQSPNRTIHNNSDKRDGM